MPAPRNSTACAKLMKCGVGAASMICCTSSGIDSRGVTPPESSCSGRMTRMMSSPNCGIERASVPRKMPIEAVENRYSAAPATNRPTEPAMGMSISSCTMKRSDSVAAISTTRALAHTLPAMISKADSGITSRCSSVPCSRSRMKAAPTSTMDSRVMLLITSITPPNHRPFTFGLKRTRATRLSGRSVLRIPASYCSSSVMMLRI